jgi:hypothetical protein
VHRSPLGLGPGPGERLLVGREVMERRRHRSEGPSGYGLGWLEGGTIPLMRK